MKKLIPFVILFITLSCVEEKIRTNDNNSSELPILSFKNIREMSSYVHKFGINGNVYSNEDVEATGFVSFDSVYREAISILASAKTMEQVSTILQTYRDVVTLSDSVFVPTMQNEFYRVICNRDRMYEAEGLAHKVVDDENIIITSLENKNSLKKINSINNLDSTIFKVAHYSDNHRGSVSGRILSDVCSNSMTYWLEYDPSGCKNDRRVYVSAQLSFAIAGDNYTPHLLSNVWGRRKLGTLCLWSDYSTILHYRNANFAVKFIINGATIMINLNTNDIPNYDGTSEESVHSIYNNDLLNGPTYWQGGTPPSVSFTRAFIEASTRGTGDTNWVSIDCIGS